MVVCDQQQSVQIDFAAAGGGLTHSGLMCFPKSLQRFGIRYQIWTRFNLTYQFVTGCQPSLELSRWPDAESAEKAFWARDVKWQK